MERPSRTKNNASTGGLKTSKNNCRGRQLALTWSPQLKGLQNSDVQIACDENLVNLEYADDIVLVFEEEENAQVFLDELTKVIPSFVYCNKTHKALYKLFLSASEIQSVGVRADTMNRQRLSAHLRNALRDACKQTKQATIKGQPLNSSITISSGCWINRGLNFEARSLRFRRISPGTANRVAKKAPLADGYVNATSHMHVGESGNQLVTLTQGRRSDDIGCISFDGENDALSTVRTSHTPITA
ncbi:hypothetical protein CLF_106806 [Clonorchis sinensis]|uniref:Reverse transcriptase domain-containing protein n=1 Tax=Clonorchis sinensis TaxID=79923 RepID=G7YFR1_CLOSI|nr:hypothetical protein CLF_106806 [Clonorchis sinensis]